MNFDPGVSSAKAELAKNKVPIGAADGYSSNHSCLVIFCAVGYPGASCCCVAMLDLKLVLLSLLFVIQVLVSGVSFNLTHEREGNTLFLFCNVWNGTTDPNLLQFWINETNRTYLTREATRVSGQFNLTAFYELAPQGEGTFFCGETDDDGVESNGLGAFTG